MFVTIPHTFGLTVTVGKTRKTYWSFLHRRGKVSKKKLGSAYTLKLEEAAEAARRIAVMVDTDGLIVDTAETLAEAIEAYCNTWTIPGKKKMITASTAAQYRRLFYRLVPLHLQKTPLAHVSRKDLGELFDRVHARTPSTATLLANVLNVVFKWRRMPQAI